MPDAYVWTGQEILDLARFGALVRSASCLIGQNDEAANLILQHALEHLRQVLGDSATPVQGVDRCVNGDRSAGTIRSPSRGRPGSGTAVQDLPREPGHQGAAATPETRPMSGDPPGALPDRPPSREVLDFS
jgi:hypothetical protein